MDEAVADIGNRGLKTTPVVARASGDHQTAVRTAIAAHKKWVRIIVEVPGGKPVSPNAPAATRTAIGFDPRKSSPQLKDALDGGFDEKYQ